MAPSPKMSTPIHSAMNDIVSKLYATCCSRGLCGTPIELSGWKRCIDPSVTASKRPAACCRGQFLHLRGM